MTIQFLEHPRMLILMCVVNLILAFYKVNQLVENATQGCALSQLSHGWQGAWKNLGRYLEQFSPLTVWDFTPEQACNAVEVTQHLTKECLAYAKETQILALCWVLAYVY